MTFAQPPGASDDCADRVARHVPGLRDLHRMIGVPAAQARDGMQAMRDKLPVLDPQADETIVREAGFTHNELFCAALTLKGWVSGRA
ncbi:MAG: hypothetical protein NTT76_26420 [Achromobacter xylosoxidans]|nr:hypothetical protein [Achromobacter xylosoxidans]